MNCICNNCLFLVRTNSNSKNIFFGFCTKYQEIEEAKTNGTCLNYVDIRNIDIEKDVQIDLDEYSISLILDLKSPKKFKPELIKSNIDEELEPSTQPTQPDQATTTKTHFDENEIEKLIQDTKPSELKELIYANGFTQTDVQREIHRSSRDISNHLAEKKYFEKIQRKIIAFCIKNEILPKLKQKSA